MADWGSAAIAAEDAWLTLTPVEEPAAFYDELGLVAGPAAHRKAPFEIGVDQLVGLQLRRVRRQEAQFDAVRVIGWLGPGRHFVHYPIAGGRAVNVFAAAPAGDYTEESWSATATVEEFHAEFAGWDPRVTRLIAAGGVPSRWALLDRAPLREWSRGRITLLGDAAHPMFPFFTQGADQPPGRPRRRPHAEHLGRPGCRTPVRQRPPGNQATEVRARQTAPSRPVSSARCPAPGGAVPPGRPSLVTK